MKSVYHDEGIEFLYDQETMQLMQIWTGFNKPEKFRGAIDFTVKFVTEKGVSSIISDTSQQKVVGPKDSEYAASTMPALVQGGLKAMAFILSPTALTKMGVNRFSKKNETPVPIGHFEDVEEAKKWIADRVKESVEA